MLRNLSLTVETSGVGYQFSSSKLSVEIVQPLGVKTTSFSVLWECIFLKIS